jgi:hypothetical protein
MQNPSFSLTWSGLLQALAGTLIGLIPYAVQTYRNRKRSDIEDAETQARTDLTRVNIRGAEFRDFAAMSEGAEKLLTALINSGDTIHELQKKIFDLEQDKLGEDMLRLDLKKATALLAYNNIRFSEAEHAEVRRLVQMLDEILDGPKSPKDSR